MVLVTLVILLQNELMVSDALPIEEHLHITFHFGDLSTCLLFK